MAIYGSKSSSRFFTALPYLTIGIIVVCSFISAYGMSFLGDDLNHGIRTHEKFPDWYQWPLVIPYQWLTGNGRFGDMIGNVLLAEAPMWLLASLSAVLEGLFYFMAIRISFPKAKQVLPRLVVLAVVMFLFPWWDSFFLFVCRINYIWSAALTLLVLWFSLFRSDKPLKSRWRWMLPFIALFAGWGHEACGMPVVVGLIVYFWNVRNFRSLPRISRASIITFSIGAFFSITSPCSYTRLGNVSSPDDTIPVLIIKSSFLVLVLILVVITALFYKRGRKEIHSLCNTPWLVLSVASICSMMFVAVGGVVGRSGLFSQIYALIAIGIFVRHSVGDSRLSIRRFPFRLISVLLFLVMAAHESGVCAYQILGNKQLKQCRDLYQQSVDGVIYASPMQRNEFPWWTLRKNKACIDNDDYWLIDVYDLRLGAPDKHYRLLPEALRNFDYKNSRVDYKDISGWVVNRRPDDVDSDNIIIHDGKQFTVVEFCSTSGDALFYISPRIIDPGDR